MSDNIYSQLKNMWLMLYEQIHSTQFDMDFIKSNFPFLDIAADNKIFIAIYNYLTLKSEFVSDNIIEILGYSPEISLNRGIANYLNYVHPDHKQYVIIGTQHFTDLVTSDNPPHWSNIKASFMGIRYNHPVKGPIRLLWQQYFLDEYSTTQPHHALYTIRDVTHLMKDDFYWFRITTIDNEPLSVYHSDLNIISKEDILSPREKQILELINAGKESDDIATLLNISRITVNNHRQNMLNKIGAKDTTALLTIAHMCKLI